MGQKLLFTQHQKQQVLVCLLQGLSIEKTARQCQIPRIIIAKWAKRVSAHDISWAESDDFNRQIRVKAFALFELGHGYKYSAKELGVPISRVKYWQEQYKVGNKEFFFSGKSRPRAYAPTKKEKILAEYKATNESKKTFCRRFDVTPATLRRWLKET